ncbi:DUF1837 domain-containing protein [Novipirellula caenicola]|uniref:Anti-bacteriophage protein A/HamA C-terminal domain-containing protein n=1 Tax=Novipirellula caenicola TaxID=1536901 RepID=A0ABP9VNF3_9BACT
MSNSHEIPTPFLDARVHDVSSDPGFTGLCAGFEKGAWRSDQLASHLIEWLPDFSLTEKEKESLGIGNIARLLNRAAQVIYDTKTASSTSRNKRGEIGEILLHACLRNLFGTLPAISKFYYKDAMNVTVKGFDAVHVVATDDSLELWLGEVKFYSNVKQAIRDAIKEIEEHTQRDYLRSEFALITNKIDDRWCHADRLKKLMDKNTSLDDVFDCLTIPVFVTYESKAIGRHKKISDAYAKEFEAEISVAYDYFVSKGLPTDIRFHLFMLPMAKKKLLVESFDRRLEACQLIGN